MTHYKLAPMVYVRVTFYFVHSMGFDKCARTRTQHQCHTERFPGPKLRLPHLQPLATPTFLLSLVSSFLGHYIVAIIQCVAFSDWLLSLMIQRAFKAPPHLFMAGSALLLGAGHGLVVGMDRSLFIHRPLRGVLAALCPGDYE